MQANLVPKLIKLIPLPNEIQPTVHTIIVYVGKDYIRLSSQLNSNRTMRH